MDRFKILAVGILLALTATTPYAKTRIILSMGGTCQSSCEGVSPKAAIVNSMALITVRISHTRDENHEYTAIPLEKPEWLKLEFSYVQEGSRQFTPSDELCDLINPIYSLRTDQLLWNKMIAEGTTPTSGAGEVYVFTSRLPEELAGKKIGVRINSLNLPYSVSPPDPNALNPSNYDYIEVVRPCSEKDIELAATSLITTAYLMENNERVVTLTDSLLETGWISDVGLYEARISASRINQPQKAQHYLDLMYETYGYTELPYEE
jgi:hypothetical protein